MSSTASAEWRVRAGGIVAAAVAIAATAFGPGIAIAQGKEKVMMNRSETLSAKQAAIASIAAATALGDMGRLTTALNHGLDAGLTVSEVKEVLVQMYAYAGFPRSLNALDQLMKVLDARQQRGLRDAPGREPAPVKTGRALLEAGTANQTKLAGAPVKGALFDFAPAIDEYLKTHLFGAIFERDNLDWQSRELATVGALAAMPGVESQLQAHIRFSLNVGLTAAQLRQVADVLAEHGPQDAGVRARTALDQHLAAPAKR